MILTKIPYCAIYDPTNLLFRFVHVSNRFRKRHPAALDRLPNLLIHHIRAEETTPVCFIFWSRTKFVVCHHETSFRGMRFIDRLVSTGTPTSWKSGTLTEDAQAERFQQILNTILFISRLHTRAYSYCG